MSTLSIDVQRAAIEDAAEIAAVHDAAWRYAYRGILDGVELERMIERRGPHWWAKAIARNVAVLVVKVEGRVAGYATLGPSRMRALPFRGGQAILVPGLLPVFVGGIGVPVGIDLQFVAGIAGKEAAVFLFGGIATIWQRPDAAAEDITVLILVNQRR